MIIKEVRAYAVLDSRRERTICVSVKTSLGSFITSAPAGKSTGRYEVKSYAAGLEGDINFINKLDLKRINKINIKRFEDLVKIERLVNKKIGGNSLFALETSLLKALACEEGKELYSFLLGNKKTAIKMPKPVGNSIEGGLHARGRNGKKPDFQEFLFIANGRSFKENVLINNLCYKLIWKLLGYWTKKRTDEGGFETNLSNEEVLGLIVNVREIVKKEYDYNVDIGIDVAASSFYKNSHYVYKNPSSRLDKNAQMNYISRLIKKYNLFYVEDAFEENDFSNFGRLLKKSGRSCLIVSDDLTTTNPSRLMKAIKLHSINAIIVKPNQIGSLLKVKEVIEIAHHAGIKTIISHRSGETLDNTIADLAVGFQCDFIKTGIYGATRWAKLKRVMKIEKKMRR